MKGERCVYVKQTNVLNGTGAKTQLLFLCIDFFRFDACLVVLLLRIFCA